MSRRFHFDTPSVMGILNVTPDSFYAGSRKQTEEEICARVNQIVEEGGDIIDVGAFSTRPGSEVVSLEEELRRMRYGLTIVRREQPEAVVSVDTFRPEVARMAVEEFGADIINDVSEGEYGLFEEMGRLKVAYILMSVQPTLELMIDKFRQEVEQLRAYGVEDIILDPGYGFGKDVIAGNYSLLAQQQKIKDEFPDLPLLVGVSRKRMIWHLLDSSPAEALNGTTVINALALERGGDILRVHDVREAVETVKIVSQMKRSFRHII